jgi:hypothetical protein
VGVDGWLRRKEDEAALVRNEDHHYSNLTFHALRAVILTHRLRSEATTVRWPTPRLRISLSKTGQSKVLVLTASIYSKFK